MPVLIHDTAEVSEDAVIGEDTRIWNHAQIREGSKIGSGCTISKNVYVDKQVVIGDRVKIQNNVSVYCGVTVEDDVFIGPSVTFTNDLYPRASVRDWKCRRTTVKRGASIGANATVICGVTVGAYAMIGAGSVVSTDVPAFALFTGNPARRKGWVCRCGHKLDAGLICQNCGARFRQSDSEGLLPLEGPAGKEIPVTKPFIDEEECKAVKEVLESGWLVQGNRVSEFERLVSEREHVKFCCAVTSCTAALQLSMLCLGMGAGMDVLMPSFTFAATANSIVSTGATPILLDVDEATYNLDPDILEAYIRKNYVRQGNNCINRTSKNILWGIVPVHQFGLCAQMDKINLIAQEYGLHIIEDGACALGAKIGNTHIGGFGNTVCVSFHPRKSVTTGEGGMILTNDESVYKKAAALRNHGSFVASRSRHEKNGCLLPEYIYPGYNFRMTDIQGAIGCVQMGKLDFILESRKKLAERYDCLIHNGCKRLKTPYAPPDFEHTYQSYVCMLDFHGDLTRGSFLRNRMMQKLESLGVMTRQGTHAVHKLDFYGKKFGYRSGDLPVSDKCDALSIALPVYADMSEEEQDYVVSCLNEVAEDVLKNENT